MASNYRIEFAARVLADAAIIGDKAAGAQHGIVPRTVRRYRAFQAQDPKLDARVKEHLRLSNRGWQHSRARFLDAYFRKALAYLPNATLMDLVRFSELVKTTGELDFFAKEMGKGARDDVGAGAGEQTDAVGEAGADQGHGHRGEGAPKV